MNLSAAAVDEIYDIAVMVQTIACLGVSHEGLKTLDNMIASCCLYLFSLCILEHKRSEVGKLKLPLLLLKKSLL